MGICLKMAFLEQILQEWYTESRKVVLMMKNISIDVLNKVEELQEWELLHKALGSRLLTLEIDITAAMKARNTSKLDEYNRMLTEGMKLSEKILAHIEDVPDSQADFIQVFPWEAQEITVQQFALAGFLQETRRLKAQFSQSDTHKEYSEKLDRLALRLKALYQKLTVRGKDTA